MGVKVTNNGFGTLSAGINSSATTVTVDSGQGARFPALSSGDFFFATLVDTSNNLEIIKVTARSTDSMTVTRAQDNTSARAFSIGDRIELRPTAALFETVLSEAIAGATPASNSITTAMLQNDSINADKIADDAIVTAAISDNAIGTAQIADDAVGNTKLDLTANYTLTGDIRTPNGFDLLSTYNETAANVNLNSDVLIHDIGTTNLATYKQFLVHSYLLNQSNGTAHVYFLYKGSNDTAKTFQGQLQGQGSQGNNNIPFQGDNSYIRTAFRLPTGHFNMVKQVITNAPTTSGMPTATVDHHGIIYEVQWVYSGSQTSHAQGSVRGTVNSTPTQKVFLNVDPGDSGGLSGNSAFRVLSHLWGVK